MTVKKKKPVRRRIKPFCDLTDAAQKRKILRLLKEIASVVNCAHRSIPARDLRNVLAAIRGPDNESVMLKQVTTSPLRYLIGLRDGCLLDVRTCDVTYFKHLRDSADIQKNMKKMGGIYIYDSHFIGHIERAITGLYNLGILK